MPLGAPSRVAALLVVLASLLGCASLPHGAVAVDSVEIRGAHEVQESAIERRIATTASPKLFLLFRGVVFDYELFDRNVFQRDLERVERLYRSRGFYDAEVRAGRIAYRSSNHVAVTIAVREGRPVIIREVRILGLETLPAEDADPVRAAIPKEIEPGERFDEDELRAAEHAMLRALTNRGYAYAEVERAAEVDLAGHYAIVTLRARPDEIASVGPITIEGLGDADEGAIRRTIGLTVGERYSSRNLEAAELALFDLGAFSTVAVEPMIERPPPPDRAVPIRVRLEQGKLHGVQLGGGFELDPIKTGIHLNLAWEDRSFFGGYRYLRIQWKPGVVFYPTRLPTLEPPHALLLEERLRLEFRQPDLFMPRMYGLLGGELNVYPVLLVPNIDPSAPVIGYREIKARAGLDRADGPVYLSPTYNLQRNLPFAYEGPRSPDLVPVTISYAGLQVNVDLRNDRIRPHRGVYVGGEIQFAGLGGDAIDARVQPEIKGYIPIAPGTTLAMRGTVGALLPGNYGGALAKAEANPLTSSHGSAFARDIQISYLRGFFSGGPSSNRGYPIRGVGPHGPVPFFSPTLVAQQLARSCETTSPSYDPVRCALPLGGLSLWESSIELRFPIAGSLGGVTFCDASDVSPNPAEIRLSHPHLSCGFGLRYDTPIGPVRVDVGYRVPGLQVIGQPFDRRIEGDPGTIFGMPIAVALGIGEAF